MYFASTIDAYDAEYAARILPLVDLIEITPDRWALQRGPGEAGIPQQHLDFLAALGARRPISLHGVGLSIGSHDRWSQAYVGRLRQLFEVLPVRWHSEHLAYCEVDGEPLGMMIELPRTRAVLDLVCARIDALQQQFQVPFLLENISCLIPEDRDAQYSRAGFLNAIVDRTGCELLLDALHLECDQHNQLLDAEDFLDELNLDAVGEIHLAGGSRYKDYRLDRPTRLVDDSTLALAQHAAVRCPQLRAITFELLHEAVDGIGLDAVVDELRRLRKAFGLPLVQAPPPMPGDALANWGGFSSHAWA